MKKPIDATGKSSVLLNARGWASFLLPIALALCLFAVILISGFGLVSRSAESVHQSMRRQLYVSAKTVDTKIETLYDSIESMAPIMAYEAGYSKEQMILAMNALRDAHGLDFVVRTDSSGIAMNYLGKEDIDLSQRDYIRKALTGKRAISLVTSGAYDAENAYVIMATPILFNGNVVGVLHGSYRTENFISLLAELTDEYGQGCDEISILSSEGAVIASSSASVNADALGGLARQIAMEGESTGTAARRREIEIDGLKRYYYFNRMSAGTDSGWYVAARVSYDYLYAQTSFARYSAIALMTVAVAITVSLLGFAISRQKLSNEVEKRSALLANALANAEKADMAKSQFLSRMSHEIRTPLNAIIGYNTIARNEMADARSDEARRQAIMKIMDCLTKSNIASKHLLTIINDVLDMSAIESGKIKVVNEKFDIKGLVNSLTAVFYSQAKAKGVDLDVKFESDMEEWIIGDPLRVNQVLTNLLSNAVKFTPDGGKVTLSIRPTVEAERIHIRFDVCDTGIGMSPESMNRLWEPFEQADPSISRRFGGTGLGLSITKTLVKLMDGTISAVSAPGEGSTFSVALSFARTRQPEQNTPYNFSNMRALIVDDDASTCDYVRLLLTRSGVRNTGVTSGADALAAVIAARDGRDPYTVCLVDWRMPQMDGFETISRIRRAVGNDLPIIVITAYDFSEVAGRASELGVSTFLSKPLFQSTLFNLFANLSGTRAPGKNEKPTRNRFPGSRVLLAEDNAMNMEIARTILESAGLTVDGAANGREAVDIFTKAPQGAYGAILMDVHMPVMNGYEATRVIRALPRADAATIPILAMTADAFAENIAESLSAGMNDHISKPIDIATLFETLRKYL